MISSLSPNQLWFVDRTSQTQNISRLPRNQCANGFYIYDWRCAAEIGSRSLQIKVLYNNCYIKIWFTRTEIVSYIEPKFRNCFFLSIIIVHVYIYLNVLLVTDIPFFKMLIDKIIGDFKWIQCASIIPRRQFKSENWAFKMLEISFLVFSLYMLMQFFLMMLID